MRRQSRCTHRHLPPYTVRRQSLWRTALMTIGEPANGVNVTNGANVNGAVSNGASTSGESAMNGAVIETTPDGTTFERLNL
jgi:hypothetical protein